MVSLAVLKWAAVFEVHPRPCCSEEASPVRGACTCCGFMPYYLLDAGVPVAGLTKAIAGLGLALPLLQAYAFGFGKPHRERQWAVKIYSVSVFLLLSEVRVLIRCLSIYCWCQVVRTEGA